MRESRLTRRSINKSRNQLYFSIAGIVVILFLALNFGPLVITSIGSTIDNITGKGTQSTKITNSSDLVPPTMDSIPAAVGENSINISGSSYYNEGEIELIINGERRDTFELSDSQDFAFEDVTLQGGDNYIKVRTIIDGKRSAFSEEKKVSFLKEAPKLEISHPSDKQSFSKADREISVRGTTDPENTVEINGFIAIVDSSGNFSYTLSLTNGDNKVTVKAVNPAGQDTTKEITVSYSE